MLRILRSRMGPIGAGIRARLLGVSIRTKTLGVLVVPMTVLLLASGVFIGGSVSDAGRAQQVQSLTEVSARVVSFVGFLQTERADTLGYLNHRATEQLGFLRDHRKLVDGQVGSLQDALGKPAFANLSPALGRAAATAVAGHDQLAVLRAEVDGGAANAAQAEARYGQVIADDLVLPELLADAVSDPQLARALRAYGTVAHLQEAAAQERDAISVSAAAGRFTPQQYVVLAGSVDQQERLVAALAGLVSVEQRQELRLRLGKADTGRFLRYRAAALGSGGNRPLSIDGPAFSAASAERLRVLTALGRSFSGTVINDAQSLGSAAQTRALLIAGLAAVVFAVVLLHALVLSRRIVRPLRRLTGAAEQIRAELPRMVQRMQTPGESPEIVIEPIRVEGADEIGRLAQAFNTVNEVTVQVAVEQAALRGSIAEMFVNVARRSQALLGRQLAFLDQLEALEEDPDILQNLFRLDHLAAQMRRNSESLLVLAGIDATRTLRAPMLLSDVVRTAIGEIENFHRIDAAVEADPAVNGRVALSVAHLLAELMANATHFSGPDTRVRVTTKFGRHEVVLVIDDNGLGMTAEELADANHRLATPPATEIAVAQRLGFYVVGRIGQRLGATVGLLPRPQGGIAATVTLPASVFAPDSLPANLTPTTAPAGETAQTPVIAAGLPNRHRAGRRPPQQRPVAGMPLPVAGPTNPVARPVPLAATVQDILPGHPLRRVGDIGRLPTQRPGSVIPAQRVPAPGPPAGLSERRTAPAPAQRPGPGATHPTSPAEHARHEVRSDESARTALAELTTLSGWTYTPETAAQPSAALSRRTATVTEDLGAPEPPRPAAAPRSAEQVRGVLSGFRAGVEKGRLDQQVAPKHDSSAKEES